MRLTHSILGFQYLRDNLTGFIQISTNSEPLNPCTAFSGQKTDTDRCLTAIFKIFFFEDVFLEVSSFINTNQKLKVEILILWGVFLLVVNSTYVFCVCFFLSRSLPWCVGSNPRTGTDHDLQGSSHDRWTKGQKRLTRQQKRRFPVRCRWRN